MQYAVVIEHQEGSNYSAYVPDLPGCVSTGDSLDEGAGQHPGGHRVPSAGHAGGWRNHSCAQHARGLRGGGVIASRVDHIEEALAAI